MIKITPSNGITVEDPYGLVSSWWLNDAKWQSSLQKPEIYSSHGNPQSLFIREKLQAGSLFRPKTLMAKSVPPAVM